MNFAPVLHPLLLVLIVLPFAALTVYGLVRSRAAGSKWVWASRLALVLVCFALMLRPGIPGGSTQVLSTNTDVILVVDTTASSIAEDWDGNKPRIDGMRKDAAAIAERYPGARFAVISFDATAQLRMPLTTDTNALKTTLDVLRPETTVKSHGSSISAANDLLEKTLEDASKAKSDTARSRMVFYMGDGEQTVSTAPESFSSSKKYVDGGAVLGYGTEKGGEMRETNSFTPPGEGEYIEYEGKPALSVIDPKNLETIANDLGVGYEQRSASDKLKLPDPPSTSTSFTDDRDRENRFELYPMIAIVAALLLCAELLRASFHISRLRQLQRSQRKANA